MYETAPGDKYVFKPGSVKQVPGKDLLMSVNTLSCKNDFKHESDVHK